MKIFFKISIALLCAISLFSCHKDLTIPDPGFDMSETILDTVRRDTSAIYNISFNVKAPNGVRSIQLIDGRSFEVIRNFDEYVNKKNFTFNYTFDFSDTDPEKDTTFVLNFKILTNDNRGYNKSVRIKSMKYSHAQVIGPSENVNIYGSLFVFDGTVDTGYYTLEQIQVFLNGEELYTLGADKLNGLHSYRIHEQESREFVAGGDYSYVIKVKDSHGEETTFSYKIVMANLKKPVAFKYYNWNAYMSAKFHYNDKGQLEAYYDPSSSKIIALHYDVEGRLVTCLRSSASSVGGSNASTMYGTGVGVWLQYNDDGSLRRFAEFKFTTNNGVTVHKLLDPFWNRNDLIPEQCTMESISATDLSGFITELSCCNDPAFNEYMEYNGQKYIVKMKGTDSNIMGPFEYVDDFEAGKKICANIAPGDKSGTNLTTITRWATVEAFVPVYQPFYCKDYPSFIQFKGSEAALSEIMFGHKYLYTTLSKFWSSDPATTVFQYPYSVRDDGVLRMFVTLDYPKQSVGGRKIFYFYYDDDPTYLWDEDMVAGIEAKYAYLK